MIQSHKNALIFVYRSFIAIVLLCLSLNSQLVAADNKLPIKQIQYLFTIKGDKENPLSLPSDVAVDRVGNIYVVDSGNHRIAVFNEGGKHISFFSKEGRKQAELTNPLGIDIAANNIYVADKDNHRVQIFNLHGAHIKSVTLRENNKLIRPVGVAVNSESNLLYVSGNNNHKLMTFNMSGKLLNQWGGEGTNRGEFRYPALISLYHKNAYVVDVLNSRVQVIDPKGELQAIVGEWGVLPGQLFRPKGVAIDQNGNIYVGDSYLGVIQVFSSDTRFQYVLGVNGKPFKFKSPTGITIDSKNRIYICEMLDNKVSVFSLEP